MKQSVLEPGIGNVYYRDGITHYAENHFDFKEVLKNQLFTVCSYNIRGIEEKIPELSLF